MTAGAGAARLLRLCILVLLAGPILAGLWETGRAAFGVLPALGATEWSLDPWRRLSGLPGLGTSLALTLWTGFAASLASLLLAGGIAAALWGRFGAQGGGRFLTPFLAAPHAALAIGLAFLLAPSGWIARALSPWATGWQVPPDIASVQDPGGMALILGLMLKEVPFLVLVMLPALARLPVAAQMAAGRAMGYGRGMVWAKVIWPQVYPLIRLPVYVVLAFSLSVVDMALILGPSHPPVLAVAVTRWFMAPDPTLILPASAAALLQAGVVLGGIGLWRLAEMALARVGRVWLRRGGRGSAAQPLMRLAAGLGVVLGLAGVLALVALAVWSVAWRWPFPAALPEVWSLRLWLNGAAGWPGALGRTALLALASTGLALGMAVAWLEAGDRGGGRPLRATAAVIYLPLIVPQVAFLYGLSVVALRAGLDGGLAVVIWGHVLFVFPYVLLTLSEAWHRLDPGLLRSAAALGAGPWRRLIAVRLPVLLRPMAVAAAIGFAVSVAQYLPTLFLGGGRVVTLTTEAVALASGGDRRITAVYAALQAALPLAVYAGALLLPAVLHRNRRGLAGGGAA